jgi:hypothetical protein
MLDVYPLRPDPMTAIVVETTEPNADTKVRLTTYWAGDFSPTEPPSDTLFLEGGELNCHDRFGDCRSKPTRQIWCDGKADEPWVFELRGTIAGTNVAIQGNDVTEGNGCEFDVSFYELEYGTHIGNGSVVTFLCEEFHNNWLAARAP